MRVGSLFSGIGGLDLGLERAGMTVAWQAEVDPYCREVLTKHWPHVPNLGDVETIEWSSVEHVDLICGGFPCQDVSKASRTRHGIDGDKSGLWRCMAAAVRDVRPRYVLVENVAALLTAGWGRVLGDLADARVRRGMDVPSRCRLWCPPSPRSDLSGGLRPWRATPDTG